MITPGGLVRARGLVLLIALLPAGVPARLAAQVLYGALVGNITDPSGAAIPGATVTATNKATGLSREATTNGAGEYSFTNLLTGAYEVKVTGQGFAPHVRSDVQISINTVTRIDFSLQVGQVSESVIVTGQAALLQTDRAEVRAEVPSTELENLPVPMGRNYQQLFRTLPGFTPPQNSNSIPSNPSRALIFSVNGASFSTNNTRIDGASSTNVFLQHNTAYVPALEAIETVNVVTNSFDAEQGLAGGAAISVQVRSGTNQIHGSGFEYHSNQHLKAKPFFLPAGERNPKLVYNQGGGTVGGPIKHDKLFYFLAYEGTWDRRAAQRFGTVPTEAMKNGDFSASPTPIYDPLTGNDRGEGRTPFGGNQIPTDRISSIVQQKIEPLIPAPNQAGGLGNNYFVSAPFQFDRHTVDAKVNYNVSSKLTLIQRLGILHFNSYNRQMFGDALGGIATAGGNPGYGDGNTYSSTTAATYVITPALVVDAYFGYTKMVTNSKQPRLDEKIGLDLLGIPGTNGPRPLEGGWPRFAVSGFSTFGINELFMPYTRDDPLYQYAANFNWTRGAHNVRFGMDLSDQQINHVQAEFPGAFAGASGGFNFGGGPTALRDGPASNRYNSWAAFLMGLPTQMGRTTQVPDYLTTRWFLSSFYVRDRWNVTPKLTVSLGVRWEYFPMLKRKDRGIERYDPETNKMLVCGIGQVPSDCGVTVSKRLFAPRIGIAYRLTQKTVWRAGYGISNDPFSLANTLRSNYPVLVTLNREGPNSFQPVGLLANGIPPSEPPDLGNGIIDVPSDYVVATMPKNFRRGYIQSWNTMVQHELKYGFTAQIGYVGTREVRRLAEWDLNAGQVIGAGEAGRPLLQKFGRTAETDIMAPIGSTHYDGLQATLQRRFAQGLDLSMNYTWSKTIGVAGVWLSNDYPAIQAQNYFNLNRAPADFDHTHNFAATALWELPFGKGRRWLNGGGVLSAIAGGWQVNNVLSLISGPPFSIWGPGDSLDLPGSGQRADQVNQTVTKLGGVGPGQVFYDPAAYATVNEPRFGTAGFNSLRAPGLVNWDFGLFREFAVTERVRLQFRAESFNFSNTPHFDIPDNDVSSDTFMQISSTTGIGRESIDERQIRFGLRFSF